MSGFRVILEVLVVLPCSLEDSRGRTEYTTMETYSTVADISKDPTAELVCYQWEEFETTVGMPGVGGDKQTYLVHWKRR